MIIGDKDIDGISLTINLNDGTTFKYNSLNDEKVREDGESEEGGVEI